MSALEVEDLRVEFGSGTHAIAPVDGVSFAVDRGECLGLVGESGCGKSMTLRAILGLLPPGGRVASGRLLLHGEARSPRRMCGSGIAMIFQEPQAALNPLARVGDLIAEAARARGASRREARSRAVALMEEVGIVDATRRRRAWPHELSGGQRQRIVIAMALAAEPSVLLCDEPTTALDVTIQDQIVALLNRLRRDRGLAMVFVTHNLSLLGRIADRIAVLYAGKVVESGPSAEVTRHPRHPYTAALLQCLPRLERASAPLAAIPGRLPDPSEIVSGCRFAPRCSLVRDECRAAQPPLLTVAETHGSACLRWRELEGVEEVQARA
jgi:oligopeptide/dipeptide ABC transporter ATP-binding protein